MLSDDYKTSIMLYSRDLLLVGSYRHYSCKKEENYLFCQKHLDLKLYIF